MSSNKTGAIQAKTLVLIIIVSAIVGAVAGVTSDYLLGERHATVPPQTRQFYLFTDALNFTGRILNIPPDIFNPEHITINLGDTVVIHYYNLEAPGGDIHTFTMGDAPFWTQASVKVDGALWNNGNIIVPQDQNVNITFTPNQPGAFKYWCTFHEPTMTGYLIVLPP